MEERSKPTTSSTPTLSPTTTTNSTATPKKHHTEYLKEQQLERIKKQKKHKSTASDTNNHFLKFTDSSGHDIEISQISSIEIYRLAVHEQTRQGEEKKEHFQFVKKLYAAALEKFEVDERGKEISSNTVSYGNCLRDFGEWIRDAGILGKAGEVYKRIVEGVGHEESIETALGIIGSAKIFLIEVRKRWGFLGGWI